MKITSATIGAHPRKEWSYLTEELGIASIESGFRIVQGVWLNYSAFFQLLLECRPVSIPVPDAHARRDAPIKKTIFCTIP